MDPKKDIREDYIDQPVNHLPPIEPIKKTKQNPWQIAFIIFLFVFVVIVGLFRSGLL